MLCWQRARTRPPQQGNAKTVEEAKKNAIPQLATEKAACFNTALIRGIFKSGSLSCVADTLNGKWLKWFTTMRGPAATEAKKWRRTCMTLQTKKHATLLVKEQPC